jgi:hypothetical protein
MGTRRSKHHKGRKPRYKDFRRDFVDHNQISTQSASHVIALIDDLRIEQNEVMGGDADANRRIEL